MVIVKRESALQKYTPAKQSPCNGKIQPDYKSRSRRFPLGPKGTEFPTYRVFL